jgi:glycosyltransferase involved in cell wall biosynthesis
LLVPADDPVALARALGRLAAGPELGARLALAAGEQARERYSVEAMARSYLALYDELLDGPRRGRST